MKNPREIPTAPMSSDAVREALHRPLSAVDPDVADAIDREIAREEEQLILIASENYASRAVLEAQGSVFTNKYAEGYPGRRYYGGCEFADRVESLAVERAKAIFGAEHANVQPHSGSQANMAVYYAVLKPGDRILSMDLSHGGHLTHGSPVSFSGTLYQAHFYGVDRQTGRIDFNRVEEIAKACLPKLIVTGYSAYPRTIDFAAFRAVADRVGAHLMADIAHIAGMVGVGIHPSPFPHADLVTTTTHKTLRGPRGGMVLCRKEHAKAIDKAVFPGLQGGPLVHVIAAKAVAFKEAQTPEFAKYQAQIVANAKALAEGLLSRGFTLLSGGTDNHLILMDLRDKGMTGKEAEEALERAGIAANKNTVPFEERPPSIASGIRLGTPILTTRGMREAEMELVAGYIARALERPADAELQAKVRDEVLALCRAFPAYR